MVQKIKLECYAYATLKSLVYTKPELGILHMPRSTKIEDPFGTFNTGLGNMGQ